MGLFPFEWQGTSSTTTIKKKILEMYAYNTPTDLRCITLFGLRILSLITSVHAIILVLKCKHLMSVYNGIRHTLNTKAKQLNNDVINNHLHLSQTQLKRHVNTSDVPLSNIQCG